MLTVLGLSLVITRLATVALTMTGLSEEAAKFQARSAFTGTGFTTAEAESVVDHPVRRRIIMALMVVRSAGLISIIISLILSFVGSDTGMDKLVRLGYLAGGVLGLWLIAQSRWLDRGMKLLIAKGLTRWTHLDTRDYASLLHLSGQYTVMELHVREGEWLAGRQLKQCRLHQEGVLVLGIYRSDGSYLGVPRGDTEIEVGDTLILYGRSESVRELDTREAGSSGEQAHSRAVSEQQREEARQEAQESESRRRRQGGEEEGEASEQGKGEKSEDNSDEGSRAG